MFKKVFIFVLIFIAAIYLLTLGYSTIEGNSVEDSNCPPPNFVTDPNANIVDTLLINDFMSYMDQKIQQVNSDLDSITTLVSGVSFNIVIDPDPIPDVSSSQNLPPPVIKMDASDPPNYGIIFKLPKGRTGRIGDRGNDGKLGPTGPTGPAGPDGNVGKRIVIL